MNQINHRNFIKLMGISAAVMTSPELVTAAGVAAPRVIVVGGGFAGSAAAKYLRLWSKYQIDVTLIDPHPFHVSSAMSNLVINGRLNLQDITFDHSVLNRRYGVKFIQGCVDDVSHSSDHSGFSVSIQDIKNTLPCDFVILAPGIDFEAIPGLDHAKIPHAWIAGSDQTLALKSQLEQMPVNGSFVMTVPKSPYRCPPAPYERACVVADILKRNGGGKVIVLDMNDRIIVEEQMFSSAFSDIYGDIIEYIPNVIIEAVDPNLKIISTNVGDFTADVLNVIPTQRASKLVSDLGLLNGNSRWATVDPISYELIFNPGIFVIGDSGGTIQPKSGHMANSQAKVCADAIIRMFAGTALTTPERLANLTTNSACYSPITHNTAIWLSAVFAYDTNSGMMKAVPASLGEAEMHNTDYFQDMLAWADYLFKDTFA